MRHAAPRQCFGCDDACPCPCSCDVAAKRVRLGPFLRFLLLQLITVFLVLRFPA